MNVWNIYLYYIIYTAKIHLFYFFDSWSTELKLSVLLVSKKHKNSPRSEWLLSIYDQADNKQATLAGNEDQTDVSSQLLYPLIFYSHRLLSMFIIAQFGGKQ